MKLFGSSGVRGVAGTELTPERVTAIAAAAGDYCAADRVAVARDTRTTGPMLADAATSGLAAVGADVDRLGVVPTPGTQSYCEREGVPALQVTASHNPPAYNGVKVIGAEGVELDRESLEAIERRVLDETPARQGYDGVGRTRDVEGVREAYVDELCEAVDRERIADADLTVAVDPGHGAGSLTSPGFFRRLGCRVVTVNSQPDGHFPGRDPEPVPENLGDLRRLVRATDADLGIAHDGDADRAVFVDERGESVDGDASLAALAAAELGADDLMVSAVNVSQRVVDAVVSMGADLELTPIGSTHIITRVRERQAAGRTVPVAGEGNGGVFFPAFRLSRDGAYIAARFLELVTEEPASDLLAPFDGYHKVRENIPYETEAEREAMLAAIADYAEQADAEVTTIDGFRLDYGDAWVLARPSGTEPLVRVYAEGRSADRAEALAADLLDAL
jgi:phosphomannomutase/phosphoglucomutase